MTDTTQNENEEVLETEGTITEETTGTPADASAPASESEQVRKLTEALSRATADYQNLLKRSESERREMATFFTESFVKKMLPTLDNLDRVVGGTPAELQTGAVYEGVKHAASGLVRVLEGMGVASFSSIGEELNPDLHEALSQGPGPVGQIISEFEKGYKLHDKVIRHAKVIVGNGD